MGRFIPTPAEVQAEIESKRAHFSVFHRHLQGQALLQQEEEQDKENEHRRRSSEHLRHIVCKFTGTLVDNEKWVAGQGHSVLLDEQTREIAAKLQEGGFNPYTDRQPLRVLGCVTGLQKTLPNYKDINLPTTIHETTAGLLY